MALNKISPMMQQYIDTKKNFNDCILLFRLGDFYEMFFDDAIIVSKELNLVLTSKDCGIEEKAPMCGVPYHAIDVYLSKLVQNGHKVAIAEQMEDPKNVKGIVKREVVKIVSPGTIISNDNINNNENNYIASIYYDTTGYGISLIDFSTGDFLTTKVEDINSIYNIIEKYNIKEILNNQILLLSDFPIEKIKKEKNILFTTLDNSYFNINEHKDNNSLNILINNINNYDSKIEQISLESICGIYL
ncbi:MAG: hypothetical protein Q4F88_02790 [Eubacteriales bacterium]|nr:hypothetical protein [Eubacteriales bacterium]